MFLLKLSLLIGVVFNKLIPSHSHGRLIEPVARSSAWRVSRKFPLYYDDSGMNCGGLYALMNNDGKCGICGENFNSEKLFEKGGKYYRGWTVKSYTQGQIIQVTVQINPNHKGVFQFSICNIDNSLEDATQECLDKNPLYDLQNQSKIYIQNQHNGRIVLKLQLPENLTCKHCVFQWKYSSGNNWGIEIKTGKVCIGCGPQEEFYGCSDVTIKPKNLDKFYTDTTNYLPTRASTAKNRPTLLNTTQTSQIDLKNLCSKGNGFYASSGCKSFYRCHNSIIYYFNCPTGTLFDTRYNICNWPYNVKCV